METTFDYLVTNDLQSDHLATDDLSLNSEQTRNTSTDESILDLSQRPSTIEITNSNQEFVLIDHWRKDFRSTYTDDINDDFNRILIVNNDHPLNIEQSLTDQLTIDLKKENSLPDEINQSQIDLYYSKEQTKSFSSSSSRIVIHELEPCLNSSSSSDFLWSKYLSLIGERSVSDEFFDHYLASIESGLKTNMKIEYCYDLEHQFYWITEIQLVSHSLIRLHYLGLPEDERTNDFWAYIYDQRCHPIGWCEQNSKSISPPSIVMEYMNSNIRSNENEENNQTPPIYLFNKEIGLTPVEQLKVGMILEIQDIDRPWTLWFVRIKTNRGGRLHLRYITNINEEEDSLDIHLFYLDRRVHSIGWTSNDLTNYSYDLPRSLRITIDKQSIIDQCLIESKKNFSPPNLFKEQEEIVKHRFIEGMKIEIFQSKTKTISLGRIGSIHNEYYFDVLIENDEENEYSFVGYSSHPYILPPHWAAEHKLPLMNGQGIRQSDDYWNFYTQKNGFSHLASERCFNLITLNTTGANQVEPGMKMEMICTLNEVDLVFSVTLIHVADHLMWLKVDDPSLFHDEQFFYHVLPINSLDIFPVGWAKFNGFQLITPIEYKMNIRTYEQNQYDLFSSVTHYPKIPHVYFNEVYLLTIYLNIRCFCGPHFCSSRLARLPSQFGPGPYRHVLIDMFHHLLSASSTNAHRALRRLDQQINSERIKTEYVKAGKKASKSLRPISIPNEPRLVYQFLRHICTQLEACPNLISIKHFDSPCSDRCDILTNIFAFSTHSKHKRTQLRAAQNRYRRRKSLLCDLKTPTTSSNIPSPVVEELIPNELILTTTKVNSNETTISLPGSDRQTRGFRVHIEPKTHTITRTNKKPKSRNIKQEPIENNNTSSALTIHFPTKESKPARSPKKKRSLSPSIDFPSSVTLNILSSSNRNQKKQRPLPISQSSSDLNFSLPKIELQQTSSLIRPIQYSIPPPIDPRNPVTWNVNDVCWYLNEAGCSFALKTIKEQEIDGAALLLLDDLNTVQNLLEFKLGPAVKFCHVVKQLRTEVIDTFNSSSSLRTSSRLSTK